MLDGFRRVGVGKWTMVDLIGWGEKGDGWTYAVDSDAVARLDGDGGAGVVDDERVGCGGVEVHGRCARLTDAFQGVAEEQGVGFGRGGLRCGRVDRFKVRGVGRHEVEVDRFGELDRSQLLVE